MSIMINNPEAVAAKHGHPAGISTKSGVLTGWPSSIPYPTQADIDLWESEYAPPVDPDDELDARIEAVDVSSVADPAVKKALIDFKLALKGRTRGRK